MEVLRMRKIKMTLAALICALLPAAVFADAAVPEPNDYIPMVSYIIVGAIGIIIIIAVIIIARKLLRRRKK